MRGTKLAAVNTRYRQGRDGVSDAYRQARWHLRCARDWAARLDAIKGRRHCKRARAIMAVALVDHLLGAAYHREFARSFRRTRKAFAAEGRVI